MKGSIATEKMEEDWERGLFNVKSHKKINLRKKFKQLHYMLFNILPIFITNSVLIYYIVFVFSRLLMISL